MGLELITKNYVCNDNHEVIKNNVKKMLTLPNGFYALQDEHDMWTIANSCGTLMPEISISSNPEKTAPSKSEFQFNSRDHICIFWKNKWHFLTPAGKISENSFDDINIQSGNPNMIGVCQNNLWGFADAWGEIKIPLISTVNSKYFVNNTDIPLPMTIPLTLEDKYTFYNPTTGKPICNILFDTATPFKYYGEINSYISIVTQGEKTNILKSDGSLFFKEYVDSFRIENFGITSVKNNLIGVHAFNGTQILPNEFEYVYYDKKYDVFLIMKNKMYGIACEAGKIIVPCNYEKNIRFGNGLYILEKNGRLVIFKPGIGEIPVPNFYPETYSSEEYFDFLTSVINYQIIN